MSMDVTSKSACVAIMTKDAWFVLQRPLRMENFTLSVLKAGEAGHVFYQEHGLRIILNGRNKSYFGLD